MSMSCNPSHVDRLADRLESARETSRAGLSLCASVVRGEGEIRATAFRKALEVFKGLGRSGRLCRGD